MSIITCSLIDLQFPCVLDAMRELGINFVVNKDKAFLIWTDSNKEFESLFVNRKKWQVVNRIPCISSLCGKVIFSRLIDKISQYFPELYSFIPKTYILPFKNQSFLRAIKKKNKSWIVKPDNSSLGLSNTIIHPGFEYSPDDTLSVAQEYLQSFTIDNKKIDLKIYVLLKSIDPLQIYVYRDGLARLRTAESTKNYITPNKENTKSSSEEVTCLLSDIFKKLEKEYLVDIKKLWSEIDDIIILSILAAYNTLNIYVKNVCPTLIYSRCFQILGFDVLLDKDMKPHILNIDYRPSLNSDFGSEGRMKKSIVRDAISIACPLEVVQDVYYTRKYEWDDYTWESFAQVNDKVSRNIALQSKIAATIGNFDEIYPTMDNEKQEIYNQVMKTMKSSHSDKNMV